MKVSLYWDSINKYNECVDLGVSIVILYFYSIFFVDRFDRIYIYATQHKKATATASTLNTISKKQFQIKESRNGLCDIGANFLSFYLFIIWFDFMAKHIQMVDE